MKTRWLVCVLPLVFTGLVAAQEAPAAAPADTTALPDSTTEDVIHFKSGGTLRGRIRDSLTTKGGLLIRTRDGKDVRVSHDQIARVVRGQRPAAPETAKATPLQAPPGSRKGLWVGLGAGWGSTGLSCEVCTNERFGGYSGYVNGGGTLSQNVLLGGEFTGWSNSEGGIQEHMTFLSLVGVFYPEANGKFYVKGGLGAMWYAGEAGTDEITATAPAAILGAGYEFRIGPTLVIAPYLNSLVTANAKFKLNGQSPGDAEIRFNLFQLGFAIAWCLPI